MKSTEQTLLAALSHPLRVRILEVLNEQLMSPSQFVDRGLMPEHLFSNPEQALSLASYHFRVLEKAGLIGVVRTLPKRGALEHIYGGEIFLLKQGGPPATDPQPTSAIALLGLAARAEGAIRSNRMDSREDRLLDWTVATLDEQGWEEISAVLGEAYKRVLEIQNATKDRLCSREDCISAVVGVVGFECDPPIDTSEPSSTSSE